MSRSDYLDALDAMLGAGAAGFSEQFADVQTSFVAGRQQPDGGFCGRQGGSDLYYTDFALRTLDLLAPDHEAIGRTADFVVSASDRLRGPVECFCPLNVCRMLERWASRAASCRRRLRTPTVGCERKIGESLRRCLLSGGGFSRGRRDGRTSAYGTFLGALCLQMLGEELPAAEVAKAVAAVRNLRRPDGGFAEQADQPPSQTNATAAAVGFLSLCDALAPDDAEGARRFLVGMQAADGGFKGHAAVARGDLLSTYTAMLTATALDGLRRVDLPGVARFVRQVALPRGGFVACLEDDLADVEYTYYGVGIAALCRMPTTKN
jgi:geranylgeranyl transferase type-2 subunit beta